MKSEFHLSIGVHSFFDEIHFFTSLLGGKVTHEETGYVNLDVFGAQITLKEVAGIKVELPELHFGFNLNLENFNELADSIMKMRSPNVVAPPTVVDAGTAIERKKCI